MTYGAAILTRVRVSVMLASEARASPTAALPSESRQPTLALQTIVSSTSTTQVAPSFVRNSNPLFSAALLEFLVFWHRPEDYTGQPPSYTNSRLSRYSARVLAAPGLSDHSLGIGSQLVPFLFRLRTGKRRLVLAHQHPKYWMPNIVDLPLPLSHAGVFSNVSFLLSHAGVFSIVSFLD